MDSLTVRFAEMQNAARSSMKSEPTVMGVCAANQSYQVAGPAFLYPKQAQQPSNPGHVRAVGLGAASRMPAASMSLRAQNRQEQYSPHHDCRSDDNPGIQIQALPICFEPPHSMRQDAPTRCKHPLAEDVHQPEIQHLRTIRRR